MTAEGWAWRTLGALGGLSLLYTHVLRPWHLQWGATSAELRRPMPGDDLVPHASLIATRAIPIDAPPEDVWPWLVQMGGYERAGWYSYDRFDNAGCPSATALVPELQHLEVGDVMLTSPSTGFVVRELDEPRHLVLLIDADGSLISSSFVLTASAGGTRLVNRVRAYFARRPRTALFAFAFDLGDFVFMRKLLLGVKWRAERARWQQPL